MGEQFSIYTKSHSSRQNTFNNQRTDFDFKLTSYAQQLCMLGKIFSRWHFDIFFLENSIWQSVRIISLGDNLHEVSDPIFKEKQEKYQFVVCWIYS